jgi:hypothetical protein
VERAHCHDIFGLSDYHQEHTSPTYSQDFIGRKINQLNPKCQNIDELRTAILQEWQQFPQERSRRLVRSMMRRVAEQALEKRKTSLSLMEIFNIALKCRVFRF